MAADPRIAERFARPVDPEPAPTWRACGHCWGQRLILVANPRPPSYRPEPCPWCCGVGDVPSTGAA